MSRQAAGICASLKLSYPDGYSEMTPNAHFLGTSREWGKNPLVIPGEDPGSPNGCQQPVLKAKSRRLRANY